jgi:hypothetical protein
MQYYCLVDTLKRRDRFALVLVESRADDATILELNVGAGRVVLERKCVLHPFFVVTLDK